MAGETFYLRFENDEPAQQYPIDEFVGWDKAKFVVKRDSGRLGMDSLLNTSDAEYTPESNHKFQKILQTDDMNGFESRVIQGVNAGDENIELDLDFASRNTNDIDSFVCGLIQDTNLQLLKRRFDTKVKLQDTLTLDGVAIDPLVPENILLKAKPVVQISTWKADENVVQPARGGTGNPSFFNHIKRIGQYDIQDTLDWLYDYVDAAGTTVNYQPADPDNFKIVHAVNNLQEVTATLKLNMKTQWNTPPVGVPAANAVVQGFFVKGAGVLEDNFNDPLKKFKFYDTEALGPTTGNTLYEFDGTVTVNIGNVNRGEFVWFYFTQRSNNNEQFMTTTFISDNSLELKVTSIAYNSVTPSFRLYDVMQYVVKSICGLEIDAASFGVGTDLYRLRMFNGNFLRGKRTQAMYITLKDILAIISQFRADYELTPDGEVFFGLFDEFYPETEIAFIPDTQFVSFRKEYNPKYTVNSLKAQFKSWQSQKENTTQNTVDSVHAEAEFLFANKNVENSREISIGWSMDAFEIEFNRRLGLEEADSTATQDDDKLFGIDVNEAAVENTNAITFTETSFLQHRFNEITGQLSLKNTGEFSWIGLGTTPGQPFAITQFPPQLNDGVYNVAAVSNTEILLNPIGFVPDNDGERSTTYTYFVDADTLVGINWTNEGLTVSGIANGDNYSNLNYALTKSILKYHQKDLATINLYHKNDYLSTTFYKNNPDAIINGVREGGEVRIGYRDGIKLQDPILTPNLYKDCVFDKDFAFWIEITRKMRSVRGYIRFIDNKGIVRKMYAESASYDNSDDMFSIDEGSEKYEPVIINIVRLDDGRIRINNEYTLSQLKYKAQGLEYRITDLEGYLLYNPIFWNRIAVNGNMAESQNQLEEWLQLL